MPRSARSLALLAPLLLLSVAPLFPQTAPVTEGATLARLSFWLPPERMAEFTAAYEGQLGPLLKEAGLTEFAHPGRATVDSVFSRLFACPSPAGFLQQKRALEQDQAFGEMLLVLGQRFGATGPDGLLRHSFRLYQYPLLPDRVVPAGPGRGHWRTFDASDGLFNASLAAVLRDREGGLWLDSDGGLFRYDGRSSMVLHPHLSGTGFPLVLQDGEGRLWIGTGTGALHTEGNSLVPLEGLSGSVSAMLEDRDSALWFATDAGVWRYDGSALTPLLGLPATEVSAMFQDRDGILWFAAGVEVIRYDGRSFTTLTPGSAYPVTSIVQDRAGNLWFGSDDGLRRYDGKTFVTFTTRNGLAGNLVRSALLDRDGGLWFGTWGRGVSRYDGGGFNTLTTLDGLAGNTVSGMLQDADGSMWFSTNAGASRYDAHTAVTFTTRDGLPSDDISSVVGDHQGRLWLGFRSGELCRYDGLTFTTYDADAHSAYSLLVDRKGAVWFTAIPEGARVPEALIRFDGRIATVFSIEDGLPPGAGRLVEGANGDLWFGGSGALSRYDGTTFTTFAMPESLATSWIVAMTQDHLGRIWLGTDGGGLLQFDGTGFRGLSRRDGLPNDRVWSLVEDAQHDLWIGTYGGGLCRYDGSTITPYTTDHGLPVDFYMGTSLADREGDYWFGTDGGGAVRYDGRAFQTLDRKDGLAGNVVRAIVRDRGGCVWLGCSGGLTRYCQPPAVEPPIRLDAVVAGRRYPSTSEVAVPSTTELVAFEFHGTSLKTRPGGMVYRYRLNGYDADWQTTREGRKEYQRLPRGTYTFEVQAVDRDLYYSEEPATVTLRVHWPYERIAWVAALTLAVLLVAGQTGRVLRRDRRLRQANSELSVANQRIQEATRHKSEFLSRMSHDLRTPMNAIIGYTRILLRRLQGGIEDRQFRNLENIQSSADNLLKLINEILDLSRIEAGRIDLKPEPVDLGRLVAESVATVEPLAKPGVELVQEVESLPAVTTDAARIRQVVMNLLGNAVKFTEKGTIRVCLRAVDGGCELSVADTGVGIPAEDLPHIFEEFRQVERQVGEKTEGTGLGLAIARKCVELLGGTIAAESEVGKGSTFTVRIGYYPGSIA